MLQTAPCISILPRFRPYRAISSPRLNLGDCAREIAFSLWNCALRYFFADVTLIEVLVDLSLRLKKRLVRVVIRLRLLQAAFFAAKYCATVRSLLLTE